MHLTLGEDRIRGEAGAIMARPGASENRFVIDNVAFRTITIIDIIHWIICEGSRRMKRRVVAGEKQREQG